MYSRTLSSSLAMVALLATAVAQDAIAQDAVAQDVATSQRSGIRVVDHPPTIARNPHYPANRPPLRPTPLIPLPIGTVTPEGWLGEMLRMQADGFHGHLTEISRFLVKQGNAWLAPDGSGTHGWEEPVYWLKGFGACAYILRDPRMLDEAKVWIEAILASQKEDGWFGPDKGRGGAATRLKGRDDLWPNMIALFCLKDWYNHSGDQRVLALMQRYFAYLQKIPDDRFLLGYWPRMRGGDLLFSVYWLHQRTGDDALLALARKVHRRTAPWRSGIANWHNVNIGQGFGEPATYWMQSGDAADRRAAYDNYTEIRTKYGQVPGGMFGGDENCRPGYTGPRQAVETCGMVEAMLTLETLTWITGDLVWADRCEDVTFNSMPASTTADLKALRYLTSPNMVLSDARSKSPGLQNGGPMLHMNPHIHRCCQHNFGHAWPYYAKHTWFATPDRGAAAVFFTDSKVELRVADGAKVSIDENTRYPFDERVEFVIGSNKPVRFPLYLRIPGWCQKPTLSIAGKSVRLPATGRFVAIDRNWQDGDTVELGLPMEIKLRRWTANSDSVSVDRGPLTFSLEIGERYAREGGNDEWPAWTIHPTTPWNYGLVLPATNPGSAFEVVQGAWPANARPFQPDGTPIRLRAKGRRIPEWQLDHRGLVHEIQQSPVRATAATEDITLIPMGAARLRVSAFPVVGEGDDARRWTEPPKPLYRARASHCYGSDTILAVADGQIPKSSGDTTIPRHTFWPHRGTKEWIQADFEKPRRVTEVSIYWFDDRPGGGCRVPQSWRILYRDGNRWVPISDASGFGVERDGFNVTTFAPVTTRALRVQIELRPEFSAGVLEWRIGRGTEGSIDLFDGKSLEGWEHYLVEPGVKMTDVWSVRDGLLVCKGKPMGYFATKKEFEDFELIIEWRWAPGKPAGNSGVLMRITGEPRALPKCAEAQLKSGSAGDIYGFHGFRAKGDAARTIESENEMVGKLSGVSKIRGNEKEPGQWNKYEIKLKDGDLTLVINGKKVNEATGLDVVSGKIGLQSEGGEIHFRTVRVLPLE